MGLKKENLIISTQKQSYTLPKDMVVFNQITSWRTGY